MRAANDDVLPNLRDLGDFTVSDRGHTRPHILYRSALPFADDSHPTAVGVWPVRTVIDLRSPRERARSEHPLRSETTSVYEITLMSDVDANESDPARTLADLYQSVLNTAGKQLAHILHLVGTAPTPILLHCAAGKDRTGIAAAMLLRLAGVDPDVIVHDYSATSEHMPAVLSRIIRHAPELGQLKPHHRDLLGVDPESMREVLAAWDAHPGGLRGWITDHGATNAEITRWIDRFVTHVPDENRVNQS
ncbi:hypothetical protein GCM10023094_55610 [Rhodococcus olei]|uniref:Protein tyrosine/serine phosphatase n=1 Tax=Rhodococcus olei TaxID=2161675 RepID=A0ABP8PS15_9NOCA